MDVEEPVSVKDLLAVRKIVAHRNCSDGIASAMIIRDVLPDVPVVFAEHNTKEFLELEAEPNMLFCDIVPPEKRVNEFIQARSIVLDHHKGVQELVESFGELGRFADEKINPGISGAGLAYRAVWCPLRDRAKTPPHMIVNFQRLIGIRDTWQKNDPDWEDARYKYAAVSFFQPSYWLDQMHPSQKGPHLACVLPGEYEVGKAQIGRHEATVKRAAESAYRFSEGGFTFAVFQGSKMVVSDTAELLRGTINVTAGFNYFFEDNKPIMIFSIRSDGSIDVSKFAKLFGGGGHTQAAGFKLDLNVGDEPSPNPYTQFQYLVRQFLA